MIFTFSLYFSIGQRFYGAMLCIKASRVVLCSQQRSFTMQTIVCPRCNGKGRSVHIRERDHISAPWYVWRECAACSGTGYQTNRLVHVVAAPSVPSFTACLAHTSERGSIPASLLALATRRF
jgi:hypothetical protein